MEIKISPSILSADFGKLQEDIDRIKSAEWVHIDVMDGHFVPNISIGPLVLKDIKTDQLKDVHLMISNPEKFIEAFAKAGADLLVVHAETTDDLPKLIDDIHALGVKAGVAINPDKKLDLIESVLDKVDMVLLMTVFPGFGGQKFMDGVVPNIVELRRRKPELDIQVDGGITDETAKIVIDAGANVLVAGSYIFGSDNPEERIGKLRNAAK